MVKSFMVLMCVVILVGFVTVNSEDLPHPSNLVDKLVLDYFESAEDFWISIEKRTKNVLVGEGTPFYQVHLNGDLLENDLESRIKDIEKNNYGYQMFTIVKGLRYKRLLTSFQSASEFNKKIMGIRNVSSSLLNITSLEQFWEAALETASNVANKIQLRFSWIKFDFYYRNLHVVCLNNKCSSDITIMFK